MLQSLTANKSLILLIISMLHDARDGKIDLIITKSVSRFARSVVILLETIRELTKLGVDVYFEEQKVHSISKDGEFLLTIIALYAEMEAWISKSDTNWGLGKGVLTDEEKDKAIKIIVKKLKNEENAKSTKK